MNQEKEKINKRHIDWDNIDYILNVLSVKMPECAEVYGVPRNGVILAAMLSHINPNLKLVMSPTPNCIIIDDIYDTGKTLKPYMNDGYEVAALYLRHGNIKHPDFWVEYIQNDDWLVFPWEK